LHAISHDLGNIRRQLRLVSVSDTGVGLPPQQADQIFNAFFTTKASWDRYGIVHQPLHR
jgi:signal transduction histidine kinase